MKSWPAAFAFVAVALILLTATVIAVARMEHNAALAIVRPDQPPVAESRSQKALPCPGPANELRCPSFGSDTPDRQVPFPEIVDNFEIVHLVQPEYTSAMAGMEGKVTMQVGIRRDGTVGGVCVVAGAPCGMDTAAVAAVKQWKFRISGRPREVIAFIDVEFPPQ